MVLLASLGVAACGTSTGSSGSSASTLLGQTFSGSHKVSSGQLNLSLTIDPSGSSTVNGPITLSFGGPFQTQGAGKLPESNFTVSASALGRSVSLGILSTGTAGYVTLQGKSYQMPQATFQKLESSFAQLSPAGRAGPGGGTLSKLGIQPLRWLTNPTIIGTETVGGAQTTHIHAGLNVPAFLNDLNTALTRTSAVKSGLSASTRQQIASAVSNPSVDVWTGTGDKTLRRLTVALTLTAKAAAAIGGARSADLGFTLGYSELNQPQTVTAPTNVRPYSEFQSKASGFLGGVQSAASGLVGGAGSSSSGATAPNTGTSPSAGTSPSTGSASTVQKYSQCIQQAGGDVGKMQQCASLLGSGG